MKVSLDSLTLMHTARVTSGRNTSDRIATSKRSNSPFLTPRHFRLDEE